MGKKDSIMLKGWGTQGISRRRTCKAKNCRRKMYNYYRNVESQSTRVNESTGPWRNRKTGRPAARKVVGGESFLLASKALSPCNRPNALNRTHPQAQQIWKSIVPSKMYSSWRAIRIRGLLDSERSRESQEKRMIRRGKVHD